MTHRLAVILDAYSRRVVGWALDLTMTARLTIGALEQAIENRRPHPASCTTPTEDFKTRVLSAILRNACAPSL